MSPFQPFVSTPPSSSSISLPSLPLQILSLGLIGWTLGVRYMPDGSEVLSDKLEKKAVDDNWVLP